MGKQKYSSVLIFLLFLSACDSNYKSNDILGSENLSSVEGEANDNNINPEENLEVSPEENESIEAEPEEPGNLDNEPKPEPTPEPEPTPQPEPNPQPLPEPVPEPKPLPDADFYLNKNYNYSEWSSQSSHAGKVVDASQATWKFANSFVPFPTVNLKCDANNPNGANLPTNRYPVEVQHNGVTLFQPLIAGEVNLESGWGPTYCNGTGIMIDNSKNVLIEGARIDRAWDGIRPRGNADGFHINNTWMSDVRDDCIENDTFSSGKVTDSLFDGCFVPFSLRAGANDSQSDATNNTLVEFEDVVVRVKGFHYIKKDGRDFGITSGHVFKVDSDSPSVSMHNAVIAYDTPDVFAAAGNLTSMLGKNSKKLHSCSNNVVLWMKDNNPPSEFGDLASCFKVYSGSQARSMWQQAKCDWIDRHPESVTRRKAGDGADCP